MDNKAWFKQAKFGMMIHFGVYAMLGGEWKGRRVDGVAEWIQSSCQIPNSEYTKLARAFNPILFDPEEWVLTAKGAGMEYLVVTAKHHDGFALFKSQWDDFNCVDGSLFGRDIIGELAQACRKHGLKLGLYYSQDQDWHEPDGGGVNHPYPGVKWTNYWDFPDDSKKNYTRCFEGKIKTQFKELLTNYGDLCLIWCDNPTDISPEQSEELYQMIKKYQPDCLVNSRIGNGRGDYTSLGDNQVPDDFKKEGLWECPATLNDTWGYKAFDNNWKSAEKVLSLKKHLNDRGINYLLNIGPDHLGRLPAPAVEILRQVGENSR